MTSLAVSRTCKWTAAARARENEREDRLFSDPLAAALAGEEGLAMLDAFNALSSSHGGPPDNPYIPIRTRVIDDALGELAGRGFRQFAVLAAGLDTRAYRLDWPAGTVVYEVDRPAVVDDKNDTLAALGAVPRCARVAVAADLAEDWRGALERSGFDARSRTAWLVEGLFVYMTEPTVNVLLDAIDAMSAEGSVIVCDVSGRALLDSPYLKPYTDELAARDMAWTFGTDEPAQLFEPRGWRASVVTAGSPEAHFGRWPYPPAPPGAPGVPRSYFVTATKEPR